MNPEKKDNISPKPEPIAHNPVSPVVYPTAFSGTYGPLEDNQPSTTPNPNVHDNSPGTGKHHINREGWRSIASTALLFLLAPVLALTITAFAFQSYQVDGASMETTLQNNDRLIVDKVPRTFSRLTNHAYVPHRGDIVIFNQAGLFGDTSGQKQLIKRVIGLPGERVVVQDGYITIYNQQHPEGFNPDRSGLYNIQAPTTSGNIDISLQANEIFVCGDNRPNSEDSREFGPVNVNNILGKLVLRVLPLGKAQSY